MVLSGLFFYHKDIYQELGRNPDMPGQNKRTQMLALLQWLTAKPDKTDMTGHSKNVRRAISTDRPDILPHTPKVWVMSGLSVRWSGPVSVRAVEESPNRLPWPGDAHPGRRAARDERQPAALAMGNDGSTRSRLPVRAPARKGSA